MDVAYGNDSRLRTGMTGLGVTYVAGVQPNTLMWPSGAGPKRRGKPKPAGGLDGMTLLGRLRGFADGKLLIAAGLEETPAKGDAWFASFKTRMDDYAQQHAMGPEENLAEEPVPSFAGMVTPDERIGPQRRERHLRRVV